MNEEAHFTIEDRKILTQVETKLDRAIQDISELKNNFATKEEVNAISVTVIDHETRLRRIELWGALAVGGLYVIYGIVQYIHP